MVSRTDHFERIRGEEAPKAVPEEDAPFISAALLDHLQARFGNFSLSVARTHDDALAVSHEVATVSGELRVIAHLRALYNAQKG